MALGVSGQISGFLLAFKQWEAAVVKHKSPRAAGRLGYFFMYVEIFEAGKA